MAKPQCSSRDKAEAVLLDFCEKLHWTLSIFDLRFLSTFWITILNEYVNFRFLIHYQALTYWNSRMWKASWIFLFWTRWIGLKTHAFCRGKSLSAYNRSAQIVQGLSRRSSPEMLCCTLVHFETLADFNWFQKPLKFSPLRVSRPVKRSRR